MNDPEILIAGRSWRIPPLAPRQNRIVLPALTSLGGRPEHRYDTLLDIVFAAISEGGTIGMAMAETFWAKRFGMATDRYGTHWMVNCEKAM